MILIAIAYEAAMKRRSVYFNGRGIQAFAGIETIKSYGTPPSWTGLNNFDLSRESNWVHGFENRNGGVQLATFYEHMNNIFL